METIELTLVSCNDLFIHQDEFYDPANDVEITDRSELLSEIQRLSNCASTLIHNGDFEKAKDFLNQIIIYQKRVDQIDLEYHKSFN